MASPHPGIHPRAPRTSHLALASATSLVCTLLGACDEPAGQDLDREPEAERPAAPALAAATPGTRSDDFDECPAGRRIAFLPVSQCTSKSKPGGTGTWTAVPLFADGTPPLAGAGAPPSVLDRYCQFTWSSTTDAPPDMTLLGDVGGDLESDCEVVWTQSDVLTSALAPHLETAYRDHLDVDGLPLASRVGVRVAVIDSLPNGAAQGRSDHGESVGALIDGVQCPTGPCPSSVDYRLALPRHGDHQLDWTHGGDFGSHGELAKAIFAAVQAWQPTAASPHLILNLSLGWEPSLFDGATPPASMPAPVRAVHDALQYASCKGALIVVAAGNASGDTCQHNALAPAIWENFSAPGTNRCAAFGLTTGPTTDRLVYAVGGLRHDGRPLASTRPNGRPRLFAPGFVAVNDSVGHPHVPLTGSSIAAASVSAVAALVWSYQSGLSRGAVIDLLYATGLPLTPAITADFGVGGSVAQVSACRALHNCQTSVCNACDSGPPDLDLLASETQNAIAALDTAGKVDTAVSTVDTITPGCHDVCGLTVDLYTDSSDLSDPCSHDGVAGLDRYTSPQPQDPPCPACFIDIFSDADHSDDTAYLTLNTTWASETITAVALELVTPQTPPTPAKRERIELGALPLVPGRVLAVTLPSSSLRSDTAVTIDVTYLLASGGSDTKSNALPVHATQPPPPAP